MFNELFNSICLFYVNCTIIFFWTHNCKRRTRIKRLALRNNKDESMSFKTNFCLFLLRKIRRFFIIRVMINVNKIFSLSKNVFASKNKEAISFKNRSISFFWMTSSFFKMWSSLESFWRFVELWIFSQRIYFFFSLSR